MAVKVKGLVLVYGPPGGGKTMFALSASTAPSKVAMLDGDSSKSKHLAAQLNLKVYVDLVREMDGLTEVKQFKKFVQIVEKLPKGLELIVWDEPIAPLLGAHSYVKQNRSEFRESWNSMGSIAGGQEWKQTRSVLLPRLYSLMQEKADLVIVCAHEKADTDQSGVRTGLTVPDVAGSLMNETGLVIRIGPNTRVHDTNVPTGLVIKNIGGLDKTMKPISYLPRRLAECTWQTIEEYLQRPFSTRETISEDEIPTNYEVHLIEGTLNPEQRRVYELARQLKAIQVEEDEASAIMGQVQDLRDKYADLSGPILANRIVADLKDTYPSLTIPKVMNVLAKLAEIREDGEETPEKE